jgi:hypothetical protein
MSLITPEEGLAVLAMCQAYHRLIELGWRDIADFEPDVKDFGPAPFLGIERGSLRPIECLFDEDEGIFTSFEDDNTSDDADREVELIMFRHYLAAELATENRTEE